MKDVLLACLLVLSDISSVVSAVGFEEGLDLRAEMCRNPVGEASVEFFIFYFFKFFYLFLLYFF